VFCYHLGIGGADDWMLKMSPRSDAKAANAEILAFDTLEVDAYNAATADLADITRGSKSVCKRSFLVTSFLYYFKRNNEPFRMRLRIGYDELFYLVTIAGAGIYYRDIPERI